MAKMTAVYPVVGKQKWDMVSDNGDKVKGARISVFDDLLDTEDKVGFFPTVFGISHDDYSLFPVVPGLYELNLSMKAGSKGQFTVVGAKHVGEYKVQTTK